MKYLVQCVLPQPPVSSQIQMAKYIEEHKEAPDIMVIDVPRSMLDYVSYPGIEELKNGVCCSSKYESTSLRFNPPHVIVFANAPPDYDKMSMDRWRVTKLAARLPT